MVHNVHDVDYSNEKGGFMKLNWQKRKGFFNYGFDDSFGTRIIKNSVSIALSFKGYWIGI